MQETSPMDEEREEEEEEEEWGASTSSSISSLPLPSSGPRDYRHLDAASLAPCIPATAFVRAHLKMYRHLAPGAQERITMPWEEVDTLALAFPGPACQEPFPLLLPAKHLVDEYNPIHDIVGTIQEVVRHTFPLLPHLFPPDKRALVVRKVVKFSNRRDPREFTAAVEEYNACVQQIRASGRSWGMCGVWFCVERASVRGCKW